MGVRFLNAGNELLYPSLGDCIDMYFVSSLLSWLGLNHRFVLAALSLLYLMSAPEVLTCPFSQSTYPSLHGEPSTSFQKCHLEPFIRDTSTSQSMWYGISWPRCISDNSINIMTSIDTAVRRMRMLVRSLTAAHSAKDFKHTIWDCAMPGQILRHVKLRGLHIDTGSITVLTQKLSAAAS